MRPALEGPPTLNRMTVRGIAVATGVAAASSAMAIGGWAADREVTAAPAATRIGALPEGAAVTRTGPPAGKKLALIKARQHRQAVRAAREARQRREQERAARSAQRPVSYDGNARQIGADLAASRYGWGAAQFSCLDALWTRESGWNPYATNPGSGAYGIPQALPGSKMSAYGADWRTNPVTQIEWGLAYINGRYGTPCSAWSSFQSNGWY